MNKRSEMRCAGALIVILVSLGGPTAWAVDIPAGDGDALVSAVESAGEGDTIRLLGQSDAVTTFQVDEQLVVNQNLTIEGQASVLPHLIVIDGSAPTGDCPGNEIENPGFEDDPHDNGWTEATDHGGPIILEDTETLAEAGIQADARNGDDMGFFQGGAVETR